MGNIDDAFTVDLLSLNDEILIVSGTADPSTGGGYEAPMGSLFLRSTGDVYRKANTADVDWASLGSAGVSDHVLLSNIGTNSHAVIDAHIADATLHFTTLDGLSDVVITTPTSEDVLQYNGSGWVNATIGTTFTRTAVNTGTYTILPTDIFIGVLYTQTGEVALTLPNSQTPGLRFDIKDEGGNAKKNKITVTPTGGETIDGGTSLTIRVDYANVSLLWTGYEWSII